MNKSRFLCKMIKKVVELYRVVEVLSSLRSSEFRQNIDSEFEATINTFTYDYFLLFQRHNIVKPLL